MSICSLKWSSQFSLPISSVIAQCPHQHLVLSDFYIFVFWWMWISGFSLHYLDYCEVELFSYAYWLPSVNSYLYLCPFSYWVVIILLSSGVLLTWRFLWKGKSQETFDVQNYYFNVIRIINIYFVGGFVPCLRNLTLRLIRYPTVFSSGSFTFHI